MRLKMEIESANHGRKRQKSVPSVDSDKAWRIVTDGWQKVRSATGDEQDRRRNWVGGAIAVYAAMTGKDATAVLAELERDLPVRVDAPAATVLDGMPEFRPGRSTPPPPRSPGAQRPVDNPV
jgi:hypothetical protein